MSVMVAGAMADVRLHPARSLLILMTVALGTAALCTALLARTSLGRAIETSFESALPPDVVIATGTATAFALALVRDHPDVAAVEPRSIVRGRIRGAGGTYATLRLTLLPSLVRQDVSRVRAGATTAGMENRTGAGLWIERSGLPVWGSDIGTPASIRLPGGLATTLPTLGTVSDGTVAPGVQDRVVYAYATPDALAGTGIRDTFDELHVRLRPAVKDARAAMASVIERLVASGLTPDRVERTARRHPHADQMAAVLLLLGLFGAVAVIVVSVLVAALVASALRAEQRRIGVARALGASRTRIVGGVLLGIGVLALPASVLGTGVGSVAALGFARFAAGELNLVVGPTATALPILMALVAGTALPLAMAAPVAFRAASIAPLAALHPERSSTGTGPVHTARQPAAYRSVAHVYAMRHLGAHPLRLALVLGALSLGGTALIGAANLHRSLDVAVERAFAARDDDIDIRLLEPIPFEAARRSVESIPGIDVIEYWGGLLTALAEVGGPQSGTRFGLLAPPRDTALLRLPVAEGRWLGETDDRELVASRNLLAREPTLVLGERVTLVAGTHRASGTLVGVIEEATEPGIYANPALYRALAGSTDAVGALRLTTTGDPSHVLARLDDALFSVGSVPAIAFERAELESATRAHFVILLILLGTIAAAALVVGALGLGASISISVIERGRDVGILRAMGASNGSVQRLFLRESLALCVVAFALGVLLSIPLSSGMATLLGRQALHISVPLHLSFTGILLWLSIALVLGRVATTAALSKSLRSSPVDSLAYD